MKKRSGEERRKESPDWKKLRLDWCWWRRKANIGSEVCRRWGAPPGSANFPLACGAFLSLAACLRPARFLGRLC